MGRPRKPTEILELAGAFKKNPARRREGEPTSPPLDGGPPEYFSDGEQAAWVDLVTAVPDGVLLQSDSLIVEISARLLAQFRTDPAMPTARIAILSSCLGRMGLSPADRSKVTVPQPEKAKESAWDQFFGGQKR